ncbi:MAG: DUF6049 family protein [Acidimicrobiales bacterium]
MPRIANCRYLLLGAARPGAVIMTSVTVALASVVLLAPAADGQFVNRLDLVGQTIYVDDEPVTIDLQLPSITEDRQLEIRIHGPYNDPDELTEAFVNPPVEDALSLFTVQQLDDLARGSDGIVSVTVPDEEVGLLIRRDPGVLLIVIDLVDGDGVIDTLVTGVIVEDDTRGASIDFAFVADARSPLAHRADGSIDIDPAMVVARVEAAVDEAPGPVLVQLNPETLSALADPRVAGGRSAIDRIRRVLEGHSLDTRSWVDIDEEGWRRAGETDRVFSQYAEGRTTIDTFLGRTADELQRLDPTAGPATLELLRSAGITAGIVEPEQLSRIDLERTHRRPVQTSDANGVAFTVIPIDRELERTLTGNDPELVAMQHFMTMLLEARSIGTDRGIVVDLDTIAAGFLDSLMQLVATTDRLGTATVEELLDRPPARDAFGGLLRVDLLTEEPSDVSAGASDIRLTESTLGSYVEMVAPADGPIVPLQIGLAASMAAELDDISRRTYTDAVFSTVVDGTANFAVLESERVTLATRRADLPLVIRNEQPVPINVIVRLTSEKLRLVGGAELTLTLRPGQTEILIPVESVSSGDARILVSVTSPDGVLDLATGSVDVRSTAISGLGLIVSIVSLSILLTWWARTILRVRRNRRAASVDHRAGSVSVPTTSPRPEPESAPSTNNNPESTS